MRPILILVEEIEVDADVVERHQEEETQKWREWHRPECQDRPTSHITHTEHTHVKTTLY
jgi:hypothetical protein